MFTVPIQPIERMVYTGETQGIHSVIPQSENRSFQHVLDGALAAITNTQQASRLDAYDLALGNVDNLGAVMVNTLKAESMVQTTVQVTSRIISAYKEIMQIQV